MFRFDFDKKNSENEKELLPQNENKLNWFPSRKIDVPPKFLKKDFDIQEYIINEKFSGFSLKLVDTEKVVKKLTEENCENIIEAESQHSDLIPAKYEGGLKVWECTNDLVNYILTQDICLRDKTILDLGCGAGIIGLIAFLRGSTVHFQDYNAEVIENLTIPNVILNCEDHEDIKKNCEFYCGDWESFANLLDSNNTNKKYDFIFTTETIYNPDNHHKLYQIFKQKLKKDGIGFIAGKTYYFGVGGSMRQFEELVLRDGIFNVETLWKSDEGLQRELIKLVRINL